MSIPVGRGFRAWTQADIEGAIAALDQANRGAAQIGATYELRLYREGFVSALRALARMFEVGYQEEPTPNVVRERTIEWPVHIMPKGD